MDLSNFIAACEAAPDVNLTHFLCASEDAVLAQYAAPPYRMDTLRLCFSMTKSFSSLAVGIAIGQGLLQLETRVCDILPEAMPESGGHAQKIRVCDLLTMSGGAAENNYASMIAAKDWVRAYFEQALPYEPGTHYLYCTHGSHVLSVIIERVSGLSLEDFLNRYLFHPMGIFEAQWEHDPQGRTAGGMGLSLYPASLVKIAQLLLNGGRYNGVAMIPEAYIKAAGSVQIVKHETKEKPYGGDGYGYQFHVGKAGFYRMDGAFGQVCLICPALHRAFIALSSNSKTETLLRLIYQHFIDRDAALAAAAEDKNSLCAVCTAADWQDEYRLADNPMGLRAVRVRRERDEYSFSLRFDDKTQQIAFCPGRETRGRTVFIKDLEEHEQEYVSFSAETDGMLEVTVYYIETPYIAVYRLLREGDGLRFAFDINCSFTLENFSAEII